MVLTDISLFARLRVPCRARGCEEKIKKTSIKFAVRNISSIFVSASDITEHDVLMR